MPLRKRLLRFSGWIFLLMMFVASVVYVAMRTNTRHEIQQRELDRRAVWMQGIDEKMADRFRGREFIDHLKNEHGFDDDAIREYLIERKRVDGEDE